MTEQDQGPKDSDITLNQEKERQEIIYACHVSNNYPMRWCDEERFRALRILAAAYRKEHDRANRAEAELAKVKGEFEAAKKVVEASALCVHLLEAEHPAWEPTIMLRKSLDALGVWPKDRGEDGK